MRIILIILICLYLSGCSSILRIEYDSTGRIKEISARGNQESSIKQNDVEIKMNNKQEPFLKDLININAAKVAE